MSGIKMVKQLKDLKWQSVSLNGVPLTGEDFNGFVALEECTDYDIGAGNISKKTNPGKKPQSFQKKTENKSLKPKKIQLDNGFTVENIGHVTPDKTNKIISKTVVSQKKGGTKVKERSESKVVENDLTVDSMLAWSNLGIPEQILKGLAEQGFEKPTRIQELCLPAAIMGRRDILGAAETGSGKTLAFGIPILSGIMQLKEKQEAGTDIYSLPYKKSSVKKKGGNADDMKLRTANIEENAPATKRIKISNSDKSVESDGNDSESSTEYVHLSEMLDSEDCADSSDDELANDEGVDLEEYHGSDSLQGGNKGCVKVIDDVEMPEVAAGEKTGRPLYALILTPTRELAVQVSQHLRSAAKYCDIQVATIVGGMAAVKQERILSKSPEIVVATPGRLWELLQSGNSHLQQLAYIKFLAIDETDRMVERNHFDELKLILERINGDVAFMKARQNFVFSATLTMVHDLPAHMRGKKITKGGKILNKRAEKMTSQLKTKKLIEMIGMTDPKIVDITQQNHGTADTLTECMITCTMEQKDVYLYYFLQRHPGRSIVFCNSIGSVKRLAQLMSILKLEVLPLHANMVQKQRLRNLERFSAKDNTILIATDVAARGLDIANVDHVIHYQVPRTAENYVHRSGRTARANKEGITILMIEPTEAYTYQKMCTTLGRTKDLPTFPIENVYLASFTSAIKLAREIEQLSTSNKRANSEHNWLEKAAKDMDILVDDDFLATKKPKMDGVEKLLQQKRKDLEHILSKPFFPRGFSFKYPSTNEPNILKPFGSDEKALKVMKDAIETGKIKREKRTSKNASFFQMEKAFKQNDATASLLKQDGGHVKGGKVEKKKFKFNKNKRIKKK